VDPPMREGEILLRTGETPPETFSQAKSRTYKRRDAERAALFSLDENPLPEKKRWRQDVKEFRQVLTEVREEYLGRMKSLSREEILVEIWKLFRRSRFRYQFQEKLLTKKLKADIEAGRPLQSFLNELRSMREEEGFALDILKYVMDQVPAALKQPSTKRSISMSIMEELVGLSEGPPQRNVLPEPSQEIVSLGVLDKATFGDMPMVEEEEEAPVLPAPTKRIPGMVNPV